MLTIALFIIMLASGNCRDLQEMPGLGKASGPLSMLTSRVSDDPPEDDLLQSLLQHGVTSQSPSAEFLLSLYEKLRQGQGLANNGADTIRSFSNSDPPSHMRSKVSLKFQLAGMADGETTQLAELRLRPVDLDQPHTTTQIKKIRISVWREGTKILTSKYRVEHTYDDREGFDVLDVTRIVRDVERRLDGNLNNTTIEVSVKYKSQQARRSRRAAEVASKAILVVYSKDKNFFSELISQLRDHMKIQKAQFADVGFTDEALEDLFLSRNRRGAKSKGTRGRCRKQGMVIDFSVIGWGEWIIYPKSYNAYQCGGRCPMPIPDKMQPTNHAVMQALLRTKDKDLALNPCCVPNKLKPISMLYYEHGELVVRHHEDMVVDSCACR